MSDEEQSPFDPTNATDKVNPFGDNPYTAPQTPFAAAPDRGLVGQVTVLAILSIVQGVLEVFMGLILGGLAAFVPVMIHMEGNAGPPEEMAWVLSVVYGVLGLLTLAAAVLHIMAGLNSYKFRRRTLGIVASCFGMVTVFTCYCAPTAMALGIYALIVYLNPQVAQAFAMGQAGRSREEIMAHFHSW